MNWKDDPFYADHIRIREAAFETYHCEISSRSYLKNGPSLPRLLTISIMYKTVCDNSLSIECHCDLNMAIVDMLGHNH